MGCGDRVGGLMHPFDIAVAEGHKAALEGQLRSDCHHDWRPVLSVRGVVCVLCRAFKSDRQVATELMEIFAGQWHLTQADGQPI